MMVVFMDDHTPTGFPAFTCPVVMHLCRAAPMDLIQGYESSGEERPESPAPPAATPTTAGSTPAAAALAPQALAALGAAPRPRSSFRP